MTMKWNFACALVVLVSTSASAADLDYTCPPVSNQSEANCSLYPKSDATFIVSVTAKADAGSAAKAWISLDISKDDKTCSAKAKKKFPFTGNGEVTDICVIKVKAGEVVSVTAQSKNENATATSIEIKVDER